jgi:hypothetical protein
MLSSKKEWVNPFGDGKAAVRMIDAVRELNG